MAFNFFGFQFGKEKEDKHKEVCRINGI